MILVGYQGIGKTTLSESSNRYIDLESSNFFINGERCKNWNIMYVNIANSLSQQGYDVFVSSHKIVREELIKSKENKCIIVPGLHLKYKWLDKLQDRWLRTRLYKDYKAFKNAEEMYDENIKDLISEKGFKLIVLKDINYDLSDLINKAREEFSNGI